MPAADPPERRDASAGVMSSRYPAEFRREQGFTERDWLRCLPGAVRACALDLTQAGQARVSIGSGSLTLGWQVLAPRAIALMRMPRLAVHYRFDAVSDDERADFMRYFDLYTMRGGG
jgi:hypothetical protein